jgi:hypothetical protein
MRSVFWQLLADISERPGGRIWRLEGTLELGARNKSVKNEKWNEAQNWGYQSKVEKGGNERKSGDGRSEKTRNLKEA